MWHKPHPFLLGLTDYGVQYRIEFVENNNIWENEKAYEFGILNVVQKSNPRANLVPSGCAFITLLSYISFAADDA